MRVASVRRLTDRALRKASARATLPRGMTWLQLKQRAEPFLDLQ